MRRHILVLAVLLAVPASARAADHPALLQIADDGSRQELPLVKSDVHVDVRGPIAQVALVQTYANPSDAPIEAVYVFPLPHESAVGGMQMTIGTRTIRAVIKRREPTYQPAV